MGEGQSPDGGCLTCPEMNYSREFYALNLKFAHQVQQVSGIPLPHVLLQYTNLYIRFGLGHALDPAHPVWQKYIHGINSAEDSLEWTYQFAQTQARLTSRGKGQSDFGCFSYSLWDGRRLRLHFHNQEPENIHPLGESRLGARLGELSRMFSAIKKDHIEVETVVGGSWLYNLSAYRRLFPPAFLSTARPGGEDYPYLVLWGQFLERNGQVRPGPARQFVDGLEKQATLVGVLDCFPLKATYLEAPVEVFYSYYPVE
jgi:hypothetical protein